MLNEKQNQLDDLLQKTAESLDISPSDYERAVSTYKAVGCWLEDGYAAKAYPLCNSRPRITVQGSMALGTVARPMKEDSEGDYDLDLVCELPVSSLEKNPINASKIKNHVGDRLKAHGTYKQKLQPEGRRCWTMEYAASEGIGFHMDILPCVLDAATGKCISESFPGNPDTGWEFTVSTIALTHKERKDAPQYEWKSGNPAGYSKWFRKQNQTFTVYSSVQKKRIFESTTGQSGRPLFNSIAEVPDELVRTPLQRTIQLFKRHRDVRFQKNSDFKPISVILTTLAANLYEGESDLFSTVKNVTSKLLLHAGLLQNPQFRLLNEKMTQMRLITRTSDGRWFIPNPVNPVENFADRWHEDNHARAKAFFQWLEWLEADIKALEEKRGLTEISNFLSKIFGERVAQEAVKKFGVKLGGEYKEARDSGKLRMSPVTGALGVAGAITVPKHNFHGD
ncbi:MAG TPA: nucleotidyltransferase [Candidatus Omnitrophota bacterium]|nr:nucleotidyltransferase [Candidatus Omnitrophota bacterium]